MSTARREVRIDSLLFSCRDLTSPKTCRFIPVLGAPLLEVLEPYARVVPVRICAGAVRDDRPKRDPSLSTANQQE